MSSYSAKLLDHFNAPRNSGVLADADAVGRGSRDGRAPYTTVYVRVDGERIVQASFQTFGCGVSIACASALTEIAIGKNVMEAMAITADHLRAALDGLPREKAFCAEIAVNALHDALQQLG